MGRQELSSEITDFCIEYGIIKNSQDVVIEKRKIEEYLEYGWFVEHLIQTLLLKTKYIKGIDNKRLKKLLAELEKLRLELGYDE